MDADTDPLVGSWYEHPDKDLRFRVLAIDEMNESIQIQYADGEIDELDLDAWYELETEPTQEPENWIEPEIELDPIAGEENIWGASPGASPRGAARQGTRWNHDEDEDDDDDYAWDEET
jgi:hypothetical protein